MATITLDGVGHAYTKNPQGDADYALKPLHHVWEQGKAYALLGPSGCGKTTLLRFMQTFMIYTEPVVVTGGGPGNATTFLSIDLVKIAIGQVDIGKAAAMSLVYNLVIIAVCYVFYTVMTQIERRGEA